MNIIIKSERDIDSMRHAGKIVASVLELLRSHLKPGMKTKELDDIAAKELVKLGAKASFKGYRGFPASLCVSINDEIVHGIPGNRVLKEGDIVSLDLGAIYDGFQGDSAITAGVGKTSSRANHLMEITKAALMEGINAARNGAKLGDISATIQDYVESRGYSVVREYTGHGIGRDLHEDPQIPNFGRAGMGPELKKGMTLAIEPMVNAGDWHTRIGGDGWVVYTADGSLSAHFEHTIAITNDKPEVLTTI
ncbi:MAG TPA: type I methionyl aminopeptidase [Dehalococcoidia bacterium]|nr:type I methionyl aminopeptidase [Dehalococcoidia bacterium]